ncbi:hypothetical protein B5S29_g1398 [[Candida] boidinii]|uniref:Unnamed protein product n=1 Tax=Candida boidinii TaxID=5477 RepID=A0ACB5TK60_CANBO|nr:hypothetical protein B5S29_g1398 [[Candida] boidinii]GME90345.1 unnamed protein product [[Candida] boidinii]
MRQTVLRNCGICQIKSNYLVGLICLFLLSSARLTYSEIIPTQQNLNFNYGDDKQQHLIPTAGGIGPVINRDTFQTTDDNNNDDDDENHDEDRCVIPGNLRNSSTNEICNYITSNCDSSVFSYSKFYYCSIIENNDIKNYTKKKFLSVLNLIALFLLLLILLLFLGALASNLTTNLTEISTVIGLDDKVAGFTLLSLGNSSPDVFSTYAAMKSNSTTLAIGELIGAASIACSVVIGCMALANPFHVNKESFLKDLTLFSILILITFFILVDGKIKIYESLILIIMYFVYIIYMICFSKDNNNEECEHAEQPIHWNNGQNDHLIDDEISQYHDEANLVDGNVHTNLNIPEHKSVRDEMYERNVVNLERGYTNRLSLMDSIRLLFGILDVLYIRGRNVFNTGEHEQDKNNVDMGVPDLVVEGNSNTAQHIQTIDTEYEPDIVPFKPSLSVVPDSSPSSRSRSPPLRSRSPREATPQITISYQQDEPMSEVSGSDSELSRSSSPNNRNIPLPTGAYRGQTSSDNITHDINTNMLSIPPPQIQRNNSNNSMTSSIMSQQSRCSHTRSNLLNTIDESRAEMAQRRATLEEERSGSGHEHTHSTQFEIASDTESGKTKTEINNHNDNNTYKDMIFVKIDTENMPYLRNIISYILAPCCLIISLTVPSPWCTENDPKMQNSKGGSEINASDAQEAENDNSEYEYEYELDKIHPTKLLTTRLFAIQLLSIPCTLESKSFFNVYFFDPIFQFKFDYQIYLITALISILNYVLFKKFQKLYFKYFNITVSFIGFIICICFINETSSEIIKILKNIGLIFNIRESLLGLTLLALANSTGDLITNIALVVADKADLALSACFGAPSFYLLLGIGLNSFIIIINNLRNSAQGDGKTNLYQIEFDVEPQLFVSSLCLIFVLSMYAILVPLNNWKITRGIGLIAVSCWIIMTGVNILIEMN